MMGWVRRCGLGRGDRIALLLVLVAVGSCRPDRGDDDAGSGDDDGANDDTTLPDDDTMPEDDDTGDDDTGGDDDDDTVTMPDCGSEAHFIEDFADVAYFGVAQWDGVGRTMARVGDVTGDGIPDLVVGGGSARNESGDIVGRVYVVSGPISAGTHSIEVAYATIQGSRAQAWLGERMSGAGDVNGDGVTEIFLGESDDEYSGSCYLVPGPIPPGPHSVPEVASARFAAEGVGDHSYDVQGAGDLDGDGFSDLVVNAWQHDSPLYGLGRAYILFGPPAEGEHSLAEADAFIEGSSEVYPAWDADGDGQTDLAVRTWWTYESSAWAYLLAGPFAAGTYQYGDEAARFVDTASAGVGSMVPLGDLNGDGFTDFARFYGGDVVGVGNLPIYYGPVPTGGDVDLREPDVVLEHEEDHYNVNNRFEYEFAPLGDFNGDGFGDFAVTLAPFCAASKVYVVPGPLEGGRHPLLDVSSRQYETHPAGGGFASVAGPGDLDADGYDDLALGVPHWEVDGVDDAGAVFVVFGGPG
ncbi:integrin alpha [Myxococcota bacterium]|nr:integrin alpha [Myxococcota bacterium]